MKFSPFYKNLWYVAYLLIITFFSLEIILRIYNPFHFRIKGDQIVLDTNKSYVVKNETIPVLDSQIIHVKNSLGFRGPEKPPASKNYFSIITVGGSTTECSYLNEGKTWSDQLLKQLQLGFNNVWLNNAGLSGHSTLGHLILMEDYIKKIKPDMVLFLIGANDRERLDLGSGDKSTSVNYYANFFTFLSKKSEVINVLVNLARVRKAKLKQLSDRYIDLASHRADSLTTTPLFDSLNIEKNTSFLMPYADRIKKLINICRVNNIEPVLLTQPSLVGKGIDSITGTDLELIKLDMGFNGKLWWTVAEMYNKVVRQVAKQENVLLIDLADLLPKSSSYFYDTVHFTNDGAEKVSNIIYTQLAPYIKQKYAARLQ